MAKFATLVHDFSGPSSQLEGSGPPMQVITGGRLRLYCVSAFVGYGTNSQTWDLVGSSVTFQAFRPSKSDGGSGGFALDNGSGREYGWTWSGSFVSSYIDGGSYQETGTAIASPYLRIRESGGTVYWELSPDGVTFTTVRTATLAPGFNGTAGFTWFAGGAPSNDTTQVSYVEVDNLNTSSTGQAAPAPFTATGTLAAARSVAVTRAGAFTATGNGPGSPSRVTMVGPARAFTSTGTLSGVGTKSTLGRAAYTAEGAVTALGRPGLRSPAPSSGSGLLTASGVARITTEAAVDLASVWLTPVADLRAGRVFPTLSALTVTTSRAGEVRRYTTGRLRTILRPGLQRSASVELKSLDREAIRFLEAHVGELLLVRDDRGRKFYGTFLDVPVVEHSYNGEGDVTLTLAEVTHSEAV